MDPTPAPAGLPAAPPWVHQLAAHLQQQRHAHGLEYDRWYQTRWWLNSAALFPVLYGLCVMLPPLNIAAPLGAAIIAFTVGNLGSVPVSSYAYLLGVRRWDIAHGYREMPPM